MCDWGGAEFVQGIEAMKFSCLQEKEGFAGAFQKVRLVFDKEDGLAFCFEVGEAFGDAFAELGADAGHGFVEQKQGCIHCGTTGEGKQLLLSVGNLGSRLLGNLSEEEFFQQGVGFVQVRCIARALKPVREQGAPKPLAGMFRQGEQDVVAHGKFADKAQVLKCSRHTEAADAKRGAPGKRCAAESHGPGIGAKEAGDEIEKRGFSRTVAAQQTGNGSRV